MNNIVTDDSWCHNCSMVFDGCIGKKITPKGGDRGRPLSKIDWKQCNLFCPQCGTKSRSKA